MRVVIVPGSFQELIFIFFRGYSSNGNSARIRSCGYGGFHANRLTEAILILIQVGITLLPRTSDEQEQETYLLYNIFFCKKRFIRNREYKGNT
jgi:hypothetical protein